MQLNFQRIANTNNVAVTAVGPNNLHISFETTATELKQVIAVFMQLAPPNFQEQTLVNGWINRIP